MTYETKEVDIDRNEVTFEFASGVVLKIQVDGFYFCISSGSFDFEGYLTCPEDLDLLRTIYVGKVSFYTLVEITMDELILEKRNQNGQRN